VHENARITLVANDQDLRLRTKQFALRILRLYRALPAKEEARILGRQVLRSGTSVGANYRAACRARSRAEFIAKLGIVLEEVDETVFWLELLLEGGIDFRGISLYRERHRSLESQRFAGFTSSFLLLQSDFSLEFFCHLHDL
jgi:four helix bundle protein